MAGSDKRRRGEGTHGGLAGIVEAEEEEFGVLVREAQLGQDIPDCALVNIHIHLPGQAGPRSRAETYTSQ